jgi:hypothetical protein
VSDCLRLGKPQCCAAAAFAKKNLGISRLYRRDAAAGSLRPLSRSTAIRTASVKGFHPHRDCGFGQVSFPGVFVDRDAVAYAIPHAIRE